MGCLEYHGECTHLRIDQSRHSDHDTCNGPGVADAIWRTIEPILPIPLDDHWLGCQPASPGRGLSFPALNIGLVTGWSRRRTRGGRTMGSCVAAPTARSATATATPRCSSPPSAASSTTATVEASPDLLRAQILSRALHQAALQPQPHPTSRVGTAVPSSVITTRPPNGEMPSGAVVVAGSGSAPFGTRWRRSRAQRCASCTGPPPVDCLISTRNQTRDKQPTEGWSPINPRGLLAVPLEGPASELRPISRPRGPLVARSSTGDDPVTEEYGTLSGVDVDDGQEGEGHEVVDALTLLSRRQSVDDCRSEARMQCPDRSHSGVGIARLRSNHERVERALVAAADLNNSHRAGGAPCRTWITRRRRGRR